MCGIAGILATDRPSDQHIAVRMIAAIAHRGPDGQAVKEFPGAVLGFARLSIIDLAERAMQPMVSADGRHALVFNGEIYNYKELRSELKDRHVFRTESDTEVLLAAFRRWGETCLDRLNGMFAFCVYDTQTRKAFLARDRFGQKPLYVAHRGGSILFASEVKALLAGGVASKPDSETWARYLVTASYDDTASTYFSGITQLLPGECARVSADGRLQRSRYYSVEDHITPRNISIEAAARETREILVDACRIHMRADVPVSIMLSGGLDSSAMLACLDIAGELSPRVKCFSVDFGADLTERPWIEAAANHHGLPTRIDTFTPERFRESIVPLMWQCEGPLGGLMFCALDDVVRACRSDGYVVLQDGSGLDECFGGYRNHHNLYVGTLLRSGSRGADAAVAEYARNWGVDEQAARRAALAELDLAGTTIDGSIPVRPDLLSHAVLSRALGHTSPGAHSGDVVRDALIDYLQIRKIPRNTRMYDRLSMAYGLELRLPFLDHRLIEFALGLPSAHYFLDGRTKGIVREAMKGFMDDDVRTATKRSIQAPQGSWLMREPIKSYVEDLVNSESFASRGLFDVSKVKATFERFCRGDFDNSFFVWQWINVEEWYRAFIDVDPLNVRHPLCPELQHALPSLEPEPALQ